MVVTTFVEEIYGRITSRRSINNKGVYEGEECMNNMRDVLKVAATLPADCGTPISPPPWLETHKLKRGQYLFRRHFKVIFVSNLVGLLCLLAVHSVLKVLVFTNRSSVIATAYKRYLSTINHLRKWYTEDIFDPSSSAFKSIQQVRKMHSNAFRSAESSNVSIVSQADMMVTQWAFFGVMLTSGRQLGICCTTEEEEGFIHLWRSIGYLLGIQDRFNLASGSLEEVRSRCTDMKEVMAGAFVSPPPQYPAMAEALLGAVHKIVPFVNPQAFIAFTHRLMKLPKPALKLSLYSTLVLKCMELNYGVLVHIPVFGIALQHFQNFLLTFAVNTCTNYPLVPRFCGRVEKGVLQVWEAILDLYHKIIIKFS